MKTTTILKSFAMAVMLSLTTAATAQPRPRHRVNHHHCTEMRHDRHCLHEMHSRHRHDPYCRCACHRFMAYDRHHRPGPGMHRHDGPHRNMDGRPGRGRHDRPDYRR